MTYPKTLQAVSDYITANADILVEAYDADPANLAHASKVVRVIEVFEKLTPHADEIEGAILEVFAGCAAQIYLENFYEKRPAAEPLFFAARDKLAIAG